MSEQRLFCALVPPAVVRTEMETLHSPLPGVHWTPSANLHLTLRFIGNCDAERLASLVAALSRVRVEPFILPVGGVGLFPTRGPAKVLWAGVGRAHTRLFQLRKQVDEALLSADPGIDVHSFQPHFTLGRFATDYDSRALAAYLVKFAGFEAPPFRVDSFHLMASELRTGRPPAYETVQSFALSEA